MQELTVAEHLSIAFEYVEDSEAQITGKRSVSFSEAQNLLTYLERAAKHFARARAIDPNVPLAIDKNITLTQNQFAALTLIKEARYCSIISKAAECELPTGWYPRDRIIGLKYLEQAVEALEKASRFDPQNSECFTELANIYKLIGDKEKALSAARHALAIHPANRDAIKFLDNAATSNFHPLWPEPSRRR